MAIQVKLFASLRERAGWSERLVTPELPPATPLSLWRQLQLPGGGEGTPSPAATPAAAGSNAEDRADGEAADRNTTAHNALPPGIRVAINQAFAAADTPLADGDELAFLPPISGG